MTLRPRSLHNPQHTVSLVMTRMITATLYSPPLYTDSLPVQHSNILLRINTDTHPKRINIRAILSHFYHFQLIRRSFVLHAHITSHRITIPHCPRSTIPNSRISSLSSPLTGPHIAHTTTHLVTHFLINCSDDSHYMSPNTAPVPSCSTPTP